MFSKISLLQCALLIGIALFSSCKKDSNDTPNTPQAEYYFSAKLDGQSVRYEIDASGKVQMSNSIDASIDPPACTYSYGCSMGLAEPEDSPYFEVYFPDLFVGDCGDVHQTFSSLFHKDLYGYGTGSGEVLIRYWDGTELWAAYPSGQENAIFEVTGSERTETPFGVYQKVSGRANCLLFNFNGDSKKLEDIKFVMSFSEQ